MKQTWHAEHTERQQRLIAAVDQQWTSEETAEILDSWDNTLRQLWISGWQTFLISVN